MNTEVTMVRIYCTEKDGLHRELLQLLHDREKVAGVTAFRGIAGFGGSGRVHEAGLLDVGMDLPIIIEFFDRPDKVEAVMQHLHNKVAPGHMVSFAAQANLD
jgi:PII-like signaling protein